MTINSRNKGKRGELEFAKLCQKQGYTDSRRGQQYSGIEGEDVVGLPGIHVEVKRVESLNIEKALQQAIRDAGDLIDRCLCTPQLRSGRKAYLGNSMAGELPAGGYPKGRKRTDPQG